MVDDMVFFPCYSVMRSVAAASIEKQTSKNWSLAVEKLFIEVNNELQGRVECASSRDSAPLRKDTRMSRTTQQTADISHGMTLRRNPNRVS